MGYFLPSFVENGPVVLKNFFFNFLYFVIISPWKGIGSSFEESWIPFIKRWSVPSLFKLSQWFWRRFLKFDFCNFVNISPFKGTAPFIWKTWIPFTQGHFVPSLVEICSLVLETMIFYIRHWIFTILTSHPTDRTYQININNSKV